MNITAKSLNEINCTLESQNWFFMENFIENNICQEIFNSYSNKKDHFKYAGIGNKNSDKENITIRSGSISWINNWDESIELKLLNSILEQVMVSISNHFYLSLKHFESQLAFYKEGDFYKAHLDQFTQKNHRQVSCCLYLNDCLDGGEFVIYKDASLQIIEKIINPKKGSLVIFFSGKIWHEVKLVKYPRLSVSTWFRDDLEMH